MKRTRTHTHTQQQRATEGGVSVQGMARVGPSKQGADESDFWFILKLVFRNTRAHTHTQEHTLTVLLQVYYRAFYNNSNYFILIFTKISPILFDFIYFFVSECELEV